MEPSPTHSPEAVSKTPCVQILPNRGLEQEEEEKEEEVGEEEEEKKSHQQKTETNVNRMCIWLNTVLNLKN